MKKPVQMAGETVAQAENVFVRVESDAGAVGWGEAAAAPTMTGETIAGMMAAIELMTPKLLGRAAYDFAGATAAMDSQLYGNSGAKAAIDMALHDLVGRASGQPVYALFGAKQRSRIAVLAVIGSEDAAADLRDAQARWNAGYRAFKIKVGLGSPEADAVRTMMLCQALKGQAQGEPCLVSADANQGFSVDGALTFVRGIGDCGLDFFEQPVSAHDLDGMSRIAAATKVPIGADEGIHSLDDIARHHERKAASGVSLKAIKLGGLSGAVCGKPAVRAAWHAGQYFLQDRRDEPRFGRRRAPGRGGAGDRLGPHRHQQRPCRGRRRQRRCASTAAMSKCRSGPGSASMSTSIGCGAASRNSNGWREYKQHSEMR